MNRANVFQSSEAMNHCCFKYKSALEIKIDKQIEETLTYVEDFFNSQLDENDSLLQEKEIFYLADKNNMAFPFRVSEGKLKLVVTNEMKSELKLSEIIREIEKGKNERQLFSK